MSEPMKTYFVLPILTLGTAFVLYHVIMIVIAWRRYRSAKRRLKHGR